MLPKERMKVTVWAIAFALPIGFGQAFPATAQEQSTKTLSNTVVQGKPKEPPVEGKLEPWPKKPDLPGFPKIPPPTKPAPTGGTTDQNKQPPNQMKKDP